MSRMPSALGRLSLCMSCTRLDHPCMYPDHMFNNLGRQLPAGKKAQVQVSKLL